MRSNGSLTDIREWPLWKRIETKRFHSLRKQMVELYSIRTGEDHPLLRDAEYISMSHVFAAALSAM
jgi:hypothetical protein